MPTTSSPWASPSSPAGRRLLQSEPATADAVPVLDAATLAVGAALAATTDARLAAASTVPTSASPAPCARSGRRPRTGRRVLAAATLVVGLLAVGAAGLDEPAPASPRAAAGPVALGRAAGAAMTPDVAPPVAGGQVVVELIDPIQTMAATPSAVEAGLAERLGTLVALAAEEQPAP